MCMCVYVAVDMPISQQLFIVYPMDLLGVDQMVNS